MKLSIIVPCFNESKNIPLILEKFSFVINRNDIEVFLVDNGSTDDTQAVLDHLVQKYNFVRVISIKKNNGYGNGITSGLSAAKGEFLGYTHADMQTDPADLIKALEIIENHPNPHNCFVKGDRKGRPFFDQFLTSGMSFFESIYMKQQLRDINAQPNIFHRDFYEVIKAKCPTDFSLDLYFLYMARKKELEIVRFDVIFPERIYGESSWNKGLISIWKLIMRTFVYSFKLKRDL